LLPECFFYAQAVVRAEKPVAPLRKESFTNYNILLMNWIPLENTDELEALLTRSNHRPQVIFKHSTRCSVSSMIKNRLERSEAPPEIDFHYLNLIRFRALSNEIATKFDVHHESPQVLLIENGECIYAEDHSAIHMEEIKEQINLA